MRVRESMFYCPAVCGSGYRMSGEAGCGKRRLCAWLPSKGWLCRGCCGVRRRTEQTAR